MCHGVTKSGSPTPREMTSWPFIFATSSKKSRMPLLGSAATWPATQRLGSVLIGTGLRLGSDVEPRAGRIADIEQETLIFVTAEHEMSGGREHALDRRKLF